jgi:hypothetical protein
LTGIPTEDVQQMRILRFKSIPNPMKTLVVSGRSLSVIRSVNSMAYYAHQPRRGPDVPADTTRVS